MPKYPLSPPIPCCNSNFIWHQTNLGYPYVMLSSHSLEVLRNWHQMMVFSRIDSMTIVHSLISPTTWQRTGNISFPLVTIPPWVNTNNVLFPGKSLSGEIPAPCFQSHLSPSPRNPDPRGSGSRSSLSRYSRGVNIRRDISFLKFHWQFDLILMDTSIMYHGSLAV